MGVRATVGQADLQTLITDVADRYGDVESVPQADLDFVVKILQAMINKDFKFRWNPELLIPTADNLLCRVANVVFDDVGAQTKPSGTLGAEPTDGNGSNTSSYKFVSSKITRNMADMLQISMLSTRSWNDQKVSWSQTQEEDIVGRIVNIMNDYDHSSIFTEFLQNAADAGATKCCFMLDQTSYPRSKLFRPRMATWQGPALVIYNNAEFTEDDFIALSKIGVGSKRGDSSKIGRHGLGFNSVYHFTDVPSVVSGEYIGFFDPQRQYLAKSRNAEGVLEAQGGQRGNFVKLNREVLSDQLAPYKGIFGCDMESHFKGTIFRIPIRTVDTQQSNNQKQPNEQNRGLGRTWTLTQIQEILRSWIEDVKVGMLFLKGMETILIDDNLRNNTSFKWTATKSVKAGGGGLSHTTPDNHAEPKQYDTSVVEIKVSKTTAHTPSIETLRWFIHTEQAFLQESPNHIKDLAQKNRWNTDRGIAIPLNFNYKSGEFHGRLFTHLPTPIPTGLPFHIHGVFALTSNRKGLAGGTERTDRLDPKRIWNRYLMQEFIPATVANAFEKLVKWMFRADTQGGPKARDIEDTIEQYFKFWPTIADTDGVHAQNFINTFVERFIRKSYSHLIFPCRFAHKTPQISLHAGKDVVFTGLNLNNAPGNIKRFICGQLQLKNHNTCDCSDKIQIQIERYWKSSNSNALDFRQIDPELVRGLIREDPKFIPQWFKSEEEKRWILGFVLKVLLESQGMAVALRSLDGLAVIPLRNGEWKKLEMSRSTVYYTTKPGMSELINGNNILVDEGLFKNVKDPKPGEVPEVDLEQIIVRLVKDASCCIKEMLPEKFTELICTENPNGVRSDLRYELWRFLKDYADLGPFGELPILQTLDGNIKPLKCAFQGLEISIDDVALKQNVSKLTPLLLELGVVMLVATQNNDNPYLLKHAPKAKRVPVLEQIARRSINSWPENRVITPEEAKILREMIQSCSANDIKGIASGLGHLRIWYSWGFSRYAPLICAHGSFFREGRGFDWNNLGDFTDLIRLPDTNHNDTNHDDIKHFAAMGARALSIVQAVKTRILPLFQNGSKEYVGEAKKAYVQIFEEVIRSVKSKKNPEAKNILQVDRSIPTLNGSFRCSSELFAVDDVLCRTIFGDKPANFPDESMRDIVSRDKHLFIFQDSSNQGVVHQCAEHVLNMTQGYTGIKPDVIRSIATTMVDFIYKNESLNIDWLDPRWKIVPTEIAMKPLDLTRVPDVPKYQSFGELMNPAWQDVVWTQCAFFPENLKPSPQFKSRYPRIGTPTAVMVVDHLKVLVTDLAPKMTQPDQQLAFNAEILRVYKTLSDVATGHNSVAIKRLLEGFHKPYLLKGHHTNPSALESWLWPRQLMLDVENSVRNVWPVPQELLPFRPFLVAVGVLQMQTVEGSVKVSARRKVSEIETRLLNCFEAQDQHSGFMDVRFQFANGRQILAHKVILVHENEYFTRFFTGIWAQYTKRDPLDPGVAIINLSNQEETYEAFYGLLYFFYADDLLDSNGPINPPPNNTVTEPDNDNADELRDRVQYLMELLHLANQYQTHRLQELVAQEMLVDKMVVTYGNVFNIRDHAEQAQCSVIQEYCEKYMRKNLDSLQTYVDGELKLFRDGLQELIGDDDGAQRAALKADIEGLENNLKILRRLGP
ncbi:hypothetical protein BGZ65_001641 [Modicella reniformis]|uniref:BTB domain-containing protein n=1 Tax=Modicella reniformis TaxID=1440133 RepID=A0A9P6MJN7_9FUNG|nr:hypothetical protein BGZ65_001641 [Modicella reniformis]